eukprot:scpid52507/ scgid23861/ 
MNRDDRCKFCVVLYLRWHWSTAILATCVGIGAQLSSLPALALEHSYPRYLRWHWSTAILATCSRDQISISISEPETPRLKLGRVETPQVVYRCNKQEIRGHPERPDFQVHI